MNKAQLKCIAIFAIFAIIGFGPVSPGCLIGMYVVMKRPMWFLQLADDLYEGKSDPESFISEPSQSTRFKCFLSLLALFTLDIAPVPVTPVVAFFLILSRPQWFYQVIKAVYNED